MNSHSSRNSMTLKGCGCVQLAHCSDDADNLGNQAMRFPGVSYLLLGLLGRGRLYYCGCSMCACNVPSAQLLSLRVDARCARLRRHDVLTF
jgi:hypothetical protein